MHFRFKFVELSSQMPTSIFTFSPFSRPPPNLSAQRVRACVGRREEMYEMYQMYEMY